MKTGTKIFLGILAVVSLAWAVNSPMVGTLIGGCPCKKYKTSEEVKK